MSSNREAWEEDAEWLEAELQKINQIPGENFEEKFCDIVTRFVNDDLDIKIARYKALKICLY
jgi:hypothetical protein